MIQEHGGCQKVAGTDDHIALDSSGCLVTRAKLGERDSAQDEHDQSTSRELFSLVGVLGLAQVILRPCRRAACMFMSMSNHTRTHMISILVAAQTYAAFVRPPALSDLAPVIAEVEVEVRGGCTQRASLDQRLQTFIFAASHPRTYRVLEIGK